MATMNRADTIIAPATASGEAGIAIVRISGADSLSALLRFFKPSVKHPKLDSHRLYHGFLRDRSENVVDEVMAVYMAAPHTYTREDVVEIQLNQATKGFINAPCCKSEQYRKYRNNNHQIR